MVIFAAGIFRYLIFSIHSNDCPKIYFCRSLGFAFPKIQRQILVISEPSNVLQYIDNEC